MDNIKINICGDLVITDKHLPTIDNEIIDFFSRSDINIVNLECPITESTNKIQKTGLHLSGNGNTIREIAKKLNINLFTLANNHIMDYGKEGLIDTLDFCNENKINTVGAGISFESAIEPVYFNCNEKKIVFLNFAENEWANSSKKQPGASPLNIIDNVNQIKKEKGNADIVIVIIHGGNEYYNLPNPRMQKQYRHYADNGADLIVGHHPHCVSGFEVYKGVPIIYSLGNFLFTKESDKESWYKGIILEINIKADNKIFFDLKYVRQSKENYSLFFLNEDQKILFQEEIQSYNKIIEEEQLLEEQWNNFLDTIKDQYLRAYSPINGVRNKKLKKILIKAGLENNFINKTHYLSVLNHIRCEAHLEASKAILEEYLRK
jgi:poly-gamma-glutamate synthesis protein (capsule biosynthesis protein)